MVLNFKTIFNILLVLIVLDFIVSFMGMTMLNITEGNPLYHQLGLVNFFIFKLIASIIALRLLYYFKKNNPNTGIWGASLLCGIYGIVFINNIYIIGCVICE